LHSREHIDFSYCLDHKSDDSIVYLQGTGGRFVNMDIDCDGTQNGPGDDGRCGSSDDTQDITAFQDTVAGYDAGINDLNAYVHPYVVFGNSGGKNKGWPSYNPQSDGVEPLSVMAVVCGNQLVSPTSNHSLCTWQGVTEKVHITERTLRSTASGATPTAPTATSPW
jgi:hypothetical protein